MTKKERGSHWKRIVDDHAASGLNASVYCRERNIKIPQFYRWRSKFQDMEYEGSKASFIQLIPHESKPESGIRIRVFENVSIEIDKGFDPFTLRAVVETLYCRG